MIRTSLSDSIPSPVVEPGAAAGNLVSRWIADHPNAIALLIFCAWMLPGLIGRDLWKPDEGYTFGLVNHILRTGDWVIPTLTGEPFMEKPPVFYLVAALFAKITSTVLPLHDGARLACALFVGLAALFMARSSSVMLPHRPVWVAPLLLIGSLGLTIHAHQLITDNALLCGFAIAIYGFALAVRRPLAGGFWLGTGTGLGFMAKGLLAPGIIGMAALVLPACYAPWRTRRYLVVLCIAFLTAAPWLSIWPVALYLRSPQLFLDWFWTNNFGRFFGFVHLGPPAEPYAYPKLLLWFALPSLPLALRALWVRREELRTDAGLQIATTVFAVMFAVLSASANARELYAMPMLIPLALLGVWGLENLPPFVTQYLHWLSALLFTALALAVWACWCAVDLGFPTRLSALLQQKQPLYASHVRLGLLSIAIVLSAGWLMLISNRPGTYRPVMTWAAGVATVWGLLGILMVNWFDTGMSYRGMLSELAQSLPAGHACIESRNLGESQRAIFEYFSDIVTDRQENPSARKDCGLLLMQTLEQASAPSPGEPWTVIWDGSRPGDYHEHFWLYRKMP